MITFTVKSAGRVIGGPLSASRALGLAWNQTVSNPRHTVTIAPVIGAPVMSLEWRKARVECRPMPRGPRLTYTRAADRLEAIERGELVTPATPGSSIP